MVRSPIEEKPATCAFFGNYLKSLYNIYHVIRKQRIYTFDLSLFGQISNILVNMEFSFDGMSLDGMRSIDCELFDEASQATACNGCATAGV